MNRNQCFTGPYYPRPINTTRRRLEELVSGDGGVTVVNPLILPDWAYRIAPEQVVADIGNVLTFTSAQSGDDVIDLGGGMLQLGGGATQVGYNIRGRTSGIDQFALGVFVDGQLVKESISGVDVNSDFVDASGQVIVSLPINGGVLELKNLSGSTVNIETGNLTINRLN